MNIGPTSYLNQRLKTMLAQLSNMSSTSPVSTNDYSDGDGSPLSCFATMPAGAANNGLAVQGKASIHG
jgi:hypothetical protein